MDGQSWKVFKQELVDAMDGKNTGVRVSAPQLASLLNVSDEMVRNWRKGRTRPRLDQLPDIARILQMGGNPSAEIEWDPLYLLRKMGLLVDFVPTVDSVLADAITAQKLRIRIARAQEAAARIGSAVGAALVTQKACELGTWAVGVYPALEGPSGFQLHVADRLTFIRTDGAPVGQGEVWGDFEEELRATDAIPSQATAPRWPGSPESLEANWVIPRVGATRSSEIQIPYPGLRCIAVVSLTVQAWANDIASHLADVLGYGQMSTRALAADLTGDWHGITNLYGRRKAHDYLLADRPTKRVWSHWDYRGPLCPDRPPQEGLKIIYVRESDELLDASRPIARGDVSLDELKATRKRMEDLVGVTPGTHMVDMSPMPSDSRTARWEQSLWALESALRWLRAEGLIDARAIHERPSPSDRTSRLRAWLSSNGWPDKDASQEPSVR